jgi:hypothetical protein
MIKFYSGQFVEKWTLYVRDSFIRLYYDNFDITLPYVKDEYPEFEIVGEEYDEKLIFKTPKYWLQIIYELNYTIRLELIDVGFDKVIVTIHSIPTILAAGLKQIGQGQVPTHGLQLIYDPFAPRDYSDSGYSDDDRANFSDTSY